MEDYEHREYPSLLDYERYEKSISYIFSVIDSISKSEERTSAQKSIVSYMVNELGRLCVELQGVYEEYLNEFEIVVAEGNDEGYSPHRCQAQREV